MIRIFAGAALALVAAGCLIGSSTSTEYEGNYVSEETLAEIQPGMDEASVVSLIGEPSSKVQTRPGAEVWTWRYRKEKTTSGSVFLLISAESTTEDSGAVRVSFLNERVVKSWRDGR
jgi:outer membrane protein assembly factor BamE (lipoprotein component of BamABCDE complex)